MTYTVKEICQKIWDIEEMYELNHMLIQGTYPWQLVRMYVYYEITRKINVFESAQQAKLSMFDKIKSFLPFIKNSILVNPLKSKKCDVLIFDHPRKVIFEGEYKDIYSYFLPKTLKKYGKNFELIESPYLNKHFTSKKYQKENNVRFNDRILLGSFIYKTKNRGKIPFTKEEKDKINDVKIAIENNFSIKIDLFRIIEDHILNFKYEYEKYKELLDKTKAKQVFLVVAYENKSLISACKDKNIEIIELQHGTISPYHLGYSYPERVMKKNGEIKEIEYFPDKILSFGDYWQDASSYPIESNNIIPIGFPYFHENSKQYKNINNESKEYKIKEENENKKSLKIENENENKENLKIENENENKENLKIEEKNETIIFISQGVIGKYLSKFAYEVAKELKDKDYKIIYKLHPGEYSNWRENYEYLNKSVQLDNFEVVDNSQVQLYELFAKSDYQVGAFSTAIYEGLAFDCKTFIIDVPGTEYLDDLINKNIVKKVKNSEEMIENLDNLDLKEYDKNYFFKDYDENIFKEILK